MNDQLEILATRAIEGDREALTQLLESIRDRIYGLALRMLWHPDDAEDATQEILIRILTHLGSFRAESKFLTWCYRIAANYLLTTRKRMAEQEEITFAEFERQLDEGLHQSALGPVFADQDRLLLEEEMKIGCTHGMLLCLDRDHRLVYILGQILEFNSVEGSRIVQIAPSAFRKRLERARNQIREFMLRKCGIVNPANPCRCAKRLGYGTQKGRIDPNNLLFAGKSISRKQLRARTVEQIHQLEELQRSAALYQSHPEFASPSALIEKLERIIGR